MTRYLPFAATALLLAGCAKDDTLPIQPQQSRSITVTATTDCVRTTLDEGENAAQVVWEDGDAIGVFTMSDKIDAHNNRLRIERGGSTVGRFSGWLHQDVMSSDIYFAYYPYDGRAEFYYDSDRTMILNAPSVQHRTGEGFDCRNCGFMVATAKTGMMYGETASFAFKNLFAILKFTLTGNGETLHRINVFGNNEEPMAGQFYVELTDGGAADPTMRFNAGGFYSAPFDATTVTLDCNTVLTSEPKSFYVAVPPQTYAYGYSAEFETSAGAMVRSNGILTGKTLRRSTIYNHPQEKFAAEYEIALRSTADWLWQTSDNTIRNVALQTGASGRNLSDGGCANCYIVTEAGNYCFRAARPDGTALWGTPADACIAFSVDEAAVKRGGNALVALFDDANKVLWSWHIWIPREDPRASHHYAGGSNALMNMNLGALCSTPDDPESYGLYYQWGRKDPFVGNGEAGETVSGYREDTAFGEVAWVTNPTRSAAYSFRVIGNDDARIPTGQSVEYATAHPTTMIYYSSNFHDGDPSGEDTAHLQSGAGTWFNSYYIKFATLWGYEHGTTTNRKTVYDPCPAGYKVPDCAANTWVGLRDHSAPTGSLNGFVCNGAYYPPAGCRDGWGSSGSGGRVRYSGYSTYYLTSKPSTNYCEVLASSMLGEMLWYPASAGVVRCVKE